MSKPLTSPANLQAKALASNWVMSVDARLAGQQVGPGLGHRVAHGADATEAGHDDAASGLPAHSAALTARNQAFWFWRGVVDGVLHRRDLLGVFVRDLDAELVFERHHQFHRVERVGTEVGHEGLFIGDLGLFHAELLGDDFLDTCFDIAHWFPQRVVNESAILAGADCGSAAGRRADRPAPCAQAMYMPPLTCSSCPVT